MLEVLAPVLLLCSSCSWWTLFGLIVASSYYSRKSKYPKLNGKYSQKSGFFFQINRIITAILLSGVSLAGRIRRRKNLQREVDLDNPHTLRPDERAANLSAYYGSDKHGNSLVVKCCRRIGGKADISILLKLADGRILTRERIVNDETLVGDGEVDPDLVSADGLRIQVIRPLKTYRIIFAGLMKVRDGVLEKSYEVCLRLWCRPLDDPAHRWIDFHPWNLAGSIANETWSGQLHERIHHLIEESDTFEQAAELRGFIDMTPVGDDQQPTEQRELTLHGIRRRVVGLLDLTSTETTVTHVARFDNGFVVTLTASSSNNVLTHLVEGFLHRPNGFVYALSWSDFHLARIPSNDNITDKYIVNFTAGRKTFSMAVELVATDPNPLSPNGKGVLYRNNAKFTLTGSSNANGFGHVEVWHLHGDKSKATPLMAPSRETGVKRQSVTSKNADKAFCLALTDDRCTDTLVTGGKAAKLAELLSANGNGHDFDIPAGFAITVDAYQRQISQQPEVRRSIDKLMRISTALSKTADPTPEQQSKIEKACSEVVALFTETPIDGKVQEEIENYLESMFENIDENGTLFAVRSSAVGEDSAEASGAGQMETFLGVSGKAEVFSAIKKCWASHFAYRAVEYRRRFCGELNSPMSVLVQELVPADVAGVLFTRHPDNGSTSRVVINASYGLGEAVVSGTVDVDTVTVQKLDDYGKKVQIYYDHLGEKATVIKATEQGVIHEDVGGSDETNKYRCCLTEDEIKRLVKVGEAIEKVFGSGRDIEFAVRRNIVSANKSDIYILQARPITTSDMEQEWELLQEFDSPLASDKECVTTANIQEMMPGVLSPLNSEGWMDNCGYCLDWGNVTLGVHPRRRVEISRTLLVANQHPFLNITMLGGLTTSELDKQAADMAIFGKKLNELTIEHLQDQNDTTSKLFMKFASTLQWILRLRPYNLMEKLESRILSQPPPSSNDPSQIFEELVAMVPLSREAVIGHLRCSEASTIGNSILLAILEKDSTKWTSTTYTDVALLLSTCTDVFSADVPIMLRDIAQSISESSDGTAKFLAMDRKEAAQWLTTKEKSGNCAELFQAFIKKHGHRCVRESELREASWRQEPEKVVDALQTMLRSGNITTPQSIKKEMSVEEAIDALETPINNTQRAILRKFVPMVRKAVGRREWAKSLAVKMFDPQRQGFNHLAQILTERGYLPDTDIIYFLSFRELQQVIRRRSPKIISRASRRRKLLPKLEKMQYDEIVFGYPKAIENVEGRAGVNVYATQQVGASAVLKGTPVGQGCITGRARVVTSLAEANQIQNGEILIVPYTDVGWSPYFPLIGGLITELGGLISHGAVVAREYGLPCVVGCKQATRIVKTGDQVTIDGKSGQLIVIQKD